MLRSFFSLCCLFALFVCAAEKTYACWCGGGGAPCEATWKASAVFVGTVISIENQEVKISVEESFRGDLGIVTTVLTGQSTCDFGFTIGRQYLIYANQASTNKIVSSILDQRSRLTTNTCTRTRLLSEASEDLTYLRNLPQSRSGGRVLGKVQHFKRNSEGADRLTPAANIRLIVENDNSKSETVTDDKGLFEIKGLSAGNYKVSIDLPPGLTAGKNETSVVVEDKGCASVNFYVQPNGRLSGVVRNTLGHPISNALITLFSADGNPDRGYKEFASTNEQGIYEFKIIPPGKYKFLIRFDGSTASTRAFPKFYHPGVPYLAQATVIEIGKGEEIQNYNLTVPELPRDRTVEGVVVSPSGTIIEDAKVLIGFEATLLYVSMDEPGRFRLKVYEGVGLAVHAYVERNGKRLMSEWVSIPATGDPGKLKLVIAAQ